MMASKLKVQMLGGFSIRCGEQSIDDSRNRMKKVWLLLAYLIFSRSSHITQDSYLALMQGSDHEESANPNGRLKAVFYRVRTLLNQLDDSAGHDWIIHKNGTYIWNPEIPLELDVEQFEALCKQAAAEPDEDARLSLLMQALELYRGDFLPKLSTESWVMPLHTYYHQMYITAAEQALVLLAARNKWQEVSALCRAALKVEPYREELYQHFMRAGIEQKDRAAARQAYEEMSELLFSNFGVMPSDESRALYREAAREEGAASVPVGEVRSQLQEPAGASGAVCCDYDFFRLLYQVQARAIVRSGDVIHIALFSLHPQRRKALSRRSLDLAMDNLQELMARNLRAGDVITRCSVSQLIVMLPQANYENSCAVCQRLVKAFYRQYPHSPVEIHTSVQPLEPRQQAGEAAQKTE